MSTNLLEMPGLVVSTFCGREEIPHIYGGSTRLCVQIGDESNSYVQIPAALLPKLIKVLQQIVRIEDLREE